MFSLFFCPFFFAIWIFGKLRLLLLSFEIMEASWSEKCLLLGKTDFVFASLMYMYESIPIMSSLAPWNFPRSIPLLSQIRNTNNCYRPNSNRFYPLLAHSYTSFPPIFFVKMMILSLISFGMLWLTSWLFFHWEQ